VLAIEAYATKRRRSPWAIAQSDPYATPRTPTAAIDGPAHRAPSGIAPRPTRTSKYGPTATTAPASTIAAPGGASSSASGSQPCSGITGAATAAATKRSAQTAPTKGTPRMAPCEAKEVRDSSGIDSVCATAVPSTSSAGPDARESATKAASIAAEPSAP
jgi:hypothetical protein